VQDAVYLSDPKKYLAGKTVPRGDGGPVGLVAAAAGQCPAAAAGHGKTLAIRPPAPDCRRPRSINQQLQFLCMKIAGWLKTAR